MYKVTLKARNQNFEYDCAPNVTPLRAARDLFIPIPNRMPTRRMWNV